tara:strand:+ start:15 stop:215 length:201 start_codon:yes stop_codon:yes gene_type:complete
MKETQILKFTWKNYVILLPGISQVNRSGKKTTDPQVKKINISGKNMSISQVNYIKKNEIPGKYYLS